MFVRVIQAALLVFVSLGGATAQNAPATHAAALEEEPTHFTIIGLAPEDQLNVRATASATGMLIGRLQMGALVKNLGCADVKKHRWCKIGDLDNPQVQGWAAARYLQPTEMAADEVGPVGEEIEPVEGETLPKP